MLIEFLNEPIKVNKKEFAKDLRINITEQKQMRLKVNLYDPEDESGYRPLDFILYSIDLPHVEGLDLSCGINCKELSMNNALKLKINFNIVKQKWKLKGTFNGRELSKTSGDVNDIVTYIKDLL